MALHISDNRSMDYISLSQIDVSQNQTQGKPVHISPYIGWIYAIR